MLGRTRRSGLKSFNRRWKRRSGSSKTLTTFASSRSWLDFRRMGIRGSPVDVGTTIGCRIRWLGVSITWVIRITEFERNRRFVDVQIKESYRPWRHEHTFWERHGETLMRDGVHHELPLGILGRLVQRLLVSRQLCAIFYYRVSQIRRIFPGSGAGTASPDST